MADDELQLSLKRVALFLSGVGYFERSSSATGSAQAPLSFQADDISDVLKSLVVFDSACDAPQVSYPTQTADELALSGLAVDLSGNPSFFELMNCLRGSEVEVGGNETVSGKILGAEKRPTLAIGMEGGTVEEAYLSLYTTEASGGPSHIARHMGFRGEDSVEEKEEKIGDSGLVRIVPLRSITSWRFTDPALSAAVAKALETLNASPKGPGRKVSLLLPAKEGESREVTVCYTVASPVWKASYRLELSGDKPYLQAWAIVDNASDTDWENVELSLHAGKPSSILYGLYTPYNVERQSVPLLFAGSAKARLFDSGWQDIDDDANGEEYFEASYESASLAPAAPKAKATRQMLAAGPDKAGGSQGGYAGDAFSFTIKNPVSLPARQSAMIPLFSGTLEGSKASVFARDMESGRQGHPALCIELTNDSGMPLPGGPAAVYDEGAYSGDSLLAYLPESEKRLIAYGDDLAVSVFKEDASRSIALLSSSVFGGVLKTTLSYTYERRYLVRSSAPSARRLIIEHDRRVSAKLLAPAKALETTADAYRFEILLEAGQEKTLTVREEEVASEEVRLLQNLELNGFSYIGSRLPEAVQAALAKARELAGAAEKAKMGLSGIQASIEEEAKTQERIRANLSAVGTQTEPGKAFLEKLMLSEEKIESLAEGLSQARQEAEKAEEALAGYINGLEL